MTETPSPGRDKRPQQVFTLAVEVGRKAGDGLPKGATGAGLLLYATGVDEAEAVREAVAVLKLADLAPLDVTGYGSLAEREAAGEEIDAEERALMARALAENAVIVAQMEPFFGEDRPAKG
ncbi:MAG: hypothetical protein Q8J98_00255 [Phaeovulum sp.]|uniref:hypothetical protein n=1 Tax=Phaeovulum sp. TaxID=2934796 RepID=UPI0027311D12|nr:hypothetical protein [Phaeovulum sp.]MDP2061521.1 hypothetical protein [Phaeovulum sp.]